MSESAERIKAGEERAGQPCGFCTPVLAPEDDAAICGECASLHHEACWDRELGCSKADCVNAPLKRLDAVPPPAAFGSPGAHAKAQPVRKKKRAPAGMKECVDCDAVMDVEQEICDDCHAINSPDGLYHGPTTNPPGATTSLVVGLIGLVAALTLGFASLWFGIWAIRSSRSAKKLLDGNPRFHGAGIITAGYVLGIVDLGIWGIFVLMRIGK